MTRAFTRPVDLHGLGRSIWAQLRLEVYGVDVRQHGWTTRAELDRIKAWLRLRPGSKLLDVGCGEAGPARLLAGESGALVVGVEADRELVQSARRDGILPTPGDGVEIVLGDACLLYTSDAADERSRVDLGGRRSIKKKKHKQKKKSKNT